MSESTFSPGFEDKVRAAMLVPDGRSEFIAALRSRLIEEAAQVSAQKPAIKVRLAWAVPALIVLTLLITTVVIGPQRVWGAVQKLLGYLPGVGYVQTDGTLLVLPQPVEVERDGVTLVVEQVVADSEQTRLIYTVTGLSMRHENSQEENAIANTSEILRMEDGKVLQPTGGRGEGWGTGYRSNLIFPALPEGITEFSLVLKRIPGALHVITPKDWVIPLKLVPATDKIVILPVEEITPITEEATEVSDVVVAAVEDQGIVFELARVVELEDGFLFEGTIKWIGEESAWPDYQSGIEVYDANGQRVPNEQVDPDPLFASRSNTKTGWAVRTYSKSSPGPWTISLPQIGLGLLPNIVFLIDLGDAPQVGQEWQVSQPFTYGDYEFILNSVVLEDGARLSDYRLSFLFTVDESVYNITVEDQERRILTGSGGTDPWENGLRSFKDYEIIPTGIRQITITEIMVEREGDWHLTWQPPESAGSYAEPERQEACIDSKDWMDLPESSRTDLPDDISGDLLLQTHTGERFPLIELVGLDSEFRQAYGYGAWGSLSPDGSTIAIPRDEGISLIDASAGSSRLLPSTANGNYPVWSPDSQQIAFFRFEEATLYRINLDGSGLSIIYKGDDIIFPVAWTQGGNIIYSAFGERMLIKSVNVTGGDPEIVYETNDRKNNRPAFSADRQWMLLEEGLIGDSGWGLYIARLDGSDRRLITSTHQGDQVNFGIGVWSPDGKWIALNAWDIWKVANNPVPVLISTETCEVIPLSWLSGNVIGWRE